MTPKDGTEKFWQSFQNAPVIMGILNVTPDSFYDGGQHNSVERAINQAARMIAEGAGIIDIGGESTRPGHLPVSPEEEAARVIPVIKALASRFDTPLSIDTTKASVADAALAAGAHVINDIWGLQKDPEMAKVAAKHNCGVIIMHNRAKKDEAIDILADMDGFFATSLKLADAAGIARNRIMLDPGVGFGKTAPQSLQVIRNLGALKKFGLPLLMGLSRKSFIGMTTGDMEADRLAGTIAANLAAITQGANVLRVHDVAEHAQALRIWVESYKAGT